jgi:hypothetical protein
MMGESLNQFILDYLLLHDWKTLLMVTYSHKSSPPLNRLLTYS